MEPQTLQNVLPPGLTPDLYKGKAFVSIVIADLEDMRIGFLPKCFGMNYKQIVYRAHVLAPNGERGVTFLKSYANSVPMSFTGSLFSIFHFNMCDVLWQGLSHLPPRSVQSVQEDLKDPNVQINNDNRINKTNNTKLMKKSSETPPKTVYFALEPWLNKNEISTSSIRTSFDMNSTSKYMPKSSHFYGQRVDEDAQSYFVEMYSAFASWKGRDNWVTVRLLRTEWDIVNVNHDPTGGLPIYNIMESNTNSNSNDNYTKPKHNTTNDTTDTHNIYNTKSTAGTGTDTNTTATTTEPPMFPSNSTKFDSIFYVHDLHYHWLASEYHPHCSEDKLKYKHSRILYSMIINVVEDVLVDEVR